MSIGKRKVEFITAYRNGKKRYKKSEYYDLNVTREYHCVMCNRGSEIRKMNWRCSLHRGGRNT